MDRAYITSYAFDDRHIQWSSIEVPGCGVLPDFAFAPLAGSMELCDPWAATPSPHRVTSIKNVGDLRGGCTTAYVAVACCSSLSMTRCRSLAGSLWRTSLRHVGGEWELAESMMTISRHAAQYWTVDRKRLQVHCGVNNGGSILLPEEVLP